MEYTTKELVYYTLSGQLKTWNPLPFVENAFADGQFCTKQYYNMLDAYQRLCARLGVTDEDADVEIIIHSLMSIERYLCDRMYDYGAYFTLHPIPFPDPPEQSMHDDR